MNPTDLKTDWFAFHITEENKDELASDINPEDIMSARNLPGDPRTFVPGYIAIFRLISADDPFIESLGTRQYSVWIATQEQFDSKFRVIGTDRYNTSRLKIIYKQ
jgi:hypothetical protein